MSKNFYFGINQIDKVVASNDAYWDGYTAVFINRKEDGYSDKYGQFIDGKWVVTFRSTPDSRGLWKVPARFVKRVK